MYDNIEDYPFEQEIKEQRRKKRMAKYPTVAIKATLAWPFFHKRSEMSGKYEVNLCNLTVAQAKKLVAIGIPKARIRKEDKAKLAAREAEGKTVFDKGARYLVVKSGERYFTLRDNDGNTLPEDTVVGNGSVATVRVSAIPYRAYGGGVMAGMGDVTIHAMVEYEAPDEAEDEEDDDDDEDWDTDA